MRRGRPGPVRRTAPVPIVVALVAALVPIRAVVAAEPLPETLEGCFRPDAPERFHRQVRTAIRISGDLPRSWADAPVLAKIVCWQGSGYRTDHRKVGGARFVWRGIFAMTVEEMRTVFGRWMTADRDAFRLSPKCFKWGWEACPNTTGNSAWAQQIIAGLRWIWLNHGTPTAAWPRPGTDAQPERDPFRRCPVSGPVYYRDDFGDRRTVGGYHPHWGNDVAAPRGRAIVAPFDGYAVGHRDSWFAGLYVTVIGPHGYVRNVHLSRFGRLGEVRTGDIVGYVGATGDARGPHDHFEWHPWALPPRLHRAPSGFTRVMDAIDPYPYLNRACRADRLTALPAGLPEGSLER